MPIIQNFVGGLGNQIFMLLNIISLSIDYNINFFLNTNKYDHKRKDFIQYKLFDNDNLKKIHQINFNNFNIINQDGLKYNKIILDSNKNYLLDGCNSGYFQSWKFFWHNKDKLKNYFNIYNPTFNEIGNIIKNMGQTIAIHVRLTDYIGNNFYTQLSAKYHENVISQYELTNYKILLFSDDVAKAKNILN